MKHAEFNWETFPASGAFCSNPCVGCPTTRLLSPADVEAALTADEILTHETPTAVSEADFATLLHLVATHGQFVETGDTDTAIELDLAGQAAQRIALGDCPHYQVN